MNEMDIEFLLKEFEILSYIFREDKEDKNQFKTYLEVRRILKEALGDTTVEEINYLKKLGKIKLIVENKIWNNTEKIQRITTVLKDD